jgi:hypothetical protein
MQIMAEKDGFHYGDVKIQRLSLRTKESPHNLADRAVFGDRPASGTLTYTKGLQHWTVTASGNTLTNVLHASLHRAKDIANKVALGASDPVDIAADLEAAGWEVYPELP